MKMNEDTRNLLIGLGIGAVVGVAAGMLLAPKSGKENREYIVGRYNDIIRRIREKRHAGRSQEQAEAEVEAEISRES
jgi:gas vesicle protein